MSDHLRIVDNKFLKYKWNGDLTDFYRIKKKNGKRVIQELKTKNIIATYDTIDEAEAFYYKQKEVENVLTELNQPIKLSEDTTIGELVFTIKSYDELDDLIKDWFPLFTELNYTENINDYFEVDIIFEINGKDFNAKYKTNMPLCVDIYHLPLKINPPRFIINGEEPYQKLDHYDLTIMEFINIIFNDNKNEVIELGPEMTLENPIDYLFNPCVIEKGTTLKDIINFVANDQLLTEWISMHSWVKNIHKFHEAVNKKSKEEEKDFTIVIEKWVQVTKNYIKSDAHWLDCYENIFGRKKGEEETYSISYTPLEEIANCPIVLEGARYFDGQKVQYLNAKFTLLDVLHAIYWDISFHGDPDDNEDFIKEMSEIVENIKTSPEEIKKYPTVKELIDSLEEDDEDDD